DRVIARQLAERDDRRAAYTRDAIARAFDQQRAGIGVAAAREQTERADEARGRTIAELCGVFVGARRVAREARGDRGACGVSERRERDRGTIARRILARDDELDERGCVALARREARLRELRREIKVGCARHATTSAQRATSAAPRPSRGSGPW